MLKCLFRVITASCFHMDFHSLQFNCTALWYDWQVGLSSTTIASSFGKAISDNKELEDYKPEDISRSLLRMISNNIGQVPFSRADLLYAINWVVCCQEVCYKNCMVLKFNKLKVLTYRKLTWQIMYDVSTFHLSVMSLALNGISIQRFYCLAFLFVLCYSLNKIILTTLDLNWLLQI